MELQIRLINVLQRIQEKKRLEKLSEWFKFHCPPTKCFINRFYTSKKIKSGIKFCGFDECTQLDESKLKKLSDTLGKDRFNRLYFGDWGNENKSENESS